MIPLEARETGYCVPLRRAASLLAGIGGLLQLPWITGLPHPRATGLAGAANVICAVVLLSISLRPMPRVAPARAEAT